jgi:hypothetical protein
MYYFVKDSRLHRYPVPRRCSVSHGEETLRDTIPHDVEQCVYCLHYWPGDEGPPKGATQRGRC